MKYCHILMVIVLMTGFCYAQTNTIIAGTDIILETPTGRLYGTLLFPPTNKRIPVVLLIAGSGPTDRNTNQFPALKTDAFKLLAEALAAEHIATLRYDKRGVGESKAAMKAESDLRFEDFIKDAADWVDLLKKDKRFSKVIIAGHSEGSLIGMLAAKKADKFVSISGPGQPADHILKEQLAKQPQTVKDVAFPILDSLNKGVIVNHVHPMLASMFRPSVQPYLISWFRYDPQHVINKMKIPVLLIQGDNDIQVSVAEAEKLAKSQVNAKKVIIPGMTHTLKIALSKETQDNLKTYTDPTLPISKDLVSAITLFIKK